MEKLAENDLTYFYLRHVVIVVTAVTTISLTPVNNKDSNHVIDRIHKTYVIREATSANAPRTTPSGFIR